MPENLTAWNFDNQGIKDKINQNNETGKNLRRGCGGRVGWRQNWDSADCGLCGACNGGRNSQSHTRVRWTCNSRRAALFPPWPLPHRQHCSAAKRVALPRCIPKSLPPYNLTGALRQSNIAQMKEQSKASETELSNKGIDNLSYGEFKALVIKMFTELTELDWKNKWKIPKMK